MWFAERDALLRTIVENPSEDTPRLVFADWLEEHDDVERAELIRLQCLIASGSLLGVERQEAEVRIHELLLRHQVAWQSELPLWEGIRWEHFDRGFISAIRVDSPRVFLEHADKILHASPIHTINFHRVYDAEARELATIRGLLSIRTLDFEDGNQVGNGGLAALAESPYLARIASLKLRSNRIGLSGLRALGESPFLRQLKVLSLDKNELFDDALLLFFEHWKHDSLRLLSLESTRISNRALIRLAHSPTFDQLVELYLSSNDIEDEGLIALANAKRLTRLQALFLSRNRIGNEGVKALANSEILKEMRYLYLRRNRIGQSGAEALAASPYLNHIRELIVGENPIGEGQEALRLRFGSKVWLN